jgi:hypothetical protein
LKYLFGVRFEVGHAQMFEIIESVLAPGGESAEVAVFSVSPLTGEETINSKYWPTHKPGSEQEQEWDDLAQVLCVNVLYML